MPGPFDPNSGLVQAQQQYYNATTNGDTTQAGTNNQQQANMYTPGQQALQGQLPSTLQSMLSGQQIPSWMTAPPEAFKAYNDNFNAFVKPNIAAQFGAGSPQIGSQQTMGNEQLAAGLYQNGMQNWMGELGNIENFAMTPTGQNTGNQVNQNWQSQYDTTGYSGDNILGTVLSKLAGGIKLP